MSGIEYLVSIDMMSTTSTLEDLSTRIGVPCDLAVSHRQGSPRGKGKAWPYTLWRLSSTAPKTASLAEHIDSVLSRVNVEPFAQVGVLPADASVFLNLGVIGGDFFVRDVSIEPRHVEALARGRIGIVVSVYRPSEAP